MNTVSRLQRQLLRDKMQGAGWEHLKTVVLGPSAESPLVRRFREADAVRRLAPMKQPTVHAHKIKWLDESFVRSEGRPGSADWLTVTGQVLLALLPDALKQGKPLTSLCEGRDLEAEPLPGHSRSTAPR